MNEFIEIRSKLGERIALRADDLVSARFTFSVKREKIYEVLSEGSGKIYGYNFENLPDGSVRVGCQEFAAEEVAKVREWCGLHVKGTSRIITFRPLQQQGSADVWFDLLPHGIASPEIEGVLSKAEVAEVLSGKRSRICNYREKWGVTFFSDGCIQIGCVRFEPGEVEKVRRWCGAGPLKQRVAQQTQAVLSTPPTTLPSDRIYAYAGKEWAESAEFRAPKKGDFWLTPGGNVWGPYEGRERPETSPRKILRPIIRQDTHVFVETGEVRAPRPGEAFVFDDFELTAQVVWCSTPSYPYPRRILRQVEGEAIRDTWASSQLMEEEGWKLRQEQVRPPAPEGFVLDGAEKRFVREGEWFIGQDVQLVPERKIIYDKPVKAHEDGGTLCDAQKRWILKPCVSAPEGFRLREFGVAQAGEWYVNTIVAPTPVKARSTHHTKTWILEPAVACPEGFELVEFRCPKEGEWFWSERAANPHPIKSAHDWPSSKRWILSPKLPLPELREWEYTGEFRAPRKEGGECFVSKDAGNVIEDCSPNVHTEPRWIVRRKPKAAEKTMWVHPSVKKTIEELKDIKREPSQQFTWQQRVKVGDSSLYHMRNSGAVWVRQDEAEEKLRQERERAEKAEQVVKTWSGQANSWEKLYHVERKRANAAEEKFARFKAQIDEAVKEGEL